MAFGANRAYNDPALGAAFANLAKAFAPPGGADLAGYATANAKRAEAQRLADMYARAGNPDLSGPEMTALDQQMAVVNGGWGNSRWKYGMDDATTRRGQDVTAQTSVGNNVRDNNRALATNRLDNTGLTIRSIYGALNPGQTRPAISEEVAGLVGLPAIPEAAGTTRPQTMDQWSAQQAEEAKRNGQWTADNTIDLIMGKNTPVQAMGPDGKPRFMAPGTAIRQGAQPAPTDRAPVRRSEGVALINGQQVPVTRAPDGLQWQLPDGQPVPPDARVMDLPKATGSNEQLGLPTTANNTAANNQAAEVTRALGVLDMYETLINNNPGAIGLAGLIRGTAQNVGATVQDLARSFGDKAPQLAETAATINRELKGVAPEFFDPAIPQAEFLQGTLAYALARTENPSGEVSRQAFERALDRVRGGGMLANTEAAKAAIAANRQVLQTQLQGIGTLRGQQPARTDPNYQQPPAAPTAMGAPKRMRFDENGNAIP